MIISSAQQKQAIQQKQQVKHNSCGLSGAGQQLRSLVLQVILQPMQLSFIVPEAPMALCQ